MTHDENLRPDMTMRIDIPPSDLPGAVDFASRSRPFSVTEKEWRFHNIKVGTPLFKLFEALYDAVLITTLDGVILAGNTRAAAFFKSTCGDLVGMKVFHLILGATDELENAVKSNLDNRQFTLVEGFCLRSDGTTFPSEIVINRLDMDAHAQLCFYVRDITVRYNAQQELQHAVERLQAHDRSRMEFVSNVSHELRTPLTSMIYAVSNMIRGVAGPMSDKVLLYLERLQSDCHRLLTTVNDILDLSQIESEKLVLVRKTVPLRSVIGGGAETLRIQADAKRIKLTFDFGNEELFANCDHQKMQRVITNVVGNAVKFTTEEGVIAISLAVDPDNANMALIRVCDTGTGIPEELLPRLTQRYFRVGEHVRGSGLGLSISRELVELHGGGIAFASPVPGTDCGTEVSIRLPLAEPPTVMLLTQDSALCSLLQGRIGGSGYRLESRDSARDVIPAFRTLRASALMIDRSLKDVNIQELVLYFRDASETRHVPIVLLDSAPLTPAEVPFYRKLHVFFVLLPLTGRMLENTLAAAVMGERELEGFPPSPAGLRRT